MTDKIYVGRKPLENYIGAILKNLSKEGSDNDSCHLVSRGSDNNGKALDIAEMVRRDNEAIVIQDIELSTDEFLNDDELDERELEVDNIDELSGEQKEDLVNMVTSIDIVIGRE